MTKMASPKKHAGGMPEFEPTDEMREAVRIMIGIGLTQEQAALAIINPRTGKGISEMTLRSAFAEELKDGRAHVDAMVAQSMIARIKGGSDTMIIWYQKNRWGWRDRVDHNIGAKNSDGGEVIVHVGFGKGPETEAPAKPNGAGTRH